MDAAICRTCLAKNRRLIPLKTARSLIQKINLDEIKSLEGGVCWECYRIMDKFSKFKLQVKLVQHSLEFKISNKCFSKLSVNSKNNYDYQFQHHIDPLTNSELNKTRINIVKEEHANSDSIHFDDENDQNVNDYDDKPDINNTVSVYVDSLEIKPNVIKSKNNTNCEIFLTEKNMVNVNNAHIKNLRAKKAKTLRKSEIQDKNVMNKFTKIVLSTEEMLDSREQRRSRPNFKKIRFKCDSCLIGFTRSDKFDEHIKKKHDESVGSYICDVCKVRYPHKSAIERHCQTHFMYYKCKLCKFETVLLWQAYAHCKFKHSGDDLNSIHCRQCSVVVRTPKEMDDHMTTEHVVYCNECGEKFKKKSTLRTHKVRIHGVKREFVCSICSKTFTKSSRLESHVAGHNAALAQQLSYCAACNVQYKSVRVYRSHLRQSAAHSPEQHPCPDCNKKFSSKVYLTKHYNFYHLKKSQFKCESCNKLFISDWRLKNHRQKHHGLTRSRNHPCDVCGKKFFTLSTLRGHQLTHSEQRTFMCEDCGDTFKQRPALYTHTKLVHKGVKRNK